MKKLFDLGNRYARECTWKDFAFVKPCLFSMGMAADQQRKTIGSDIVREE